jgi:hypothetical protein
VSKALGSVTIATVGPLLRTLAVGSAADRVGLPRRLLARRTASRSPAAVGVGLLFLLADSRRASIVVSNHPASLPAFLPYLVEDDAVVFVVQRPSVGRSYTASRDTPVPLGIPRIPSKRGTPSSPIQVELWWSDAAVELLVVHSAGRSRLVAPDVERECGERWLTTESGPLGLLNGPCAPNEMKSAHMPQLRSHSPPRPREPCRQRPQPSSGLGHARSAAR